MPLFFYFIVLHPRGVCKKKKGKYMDKIALSH